MTAGANYQYRTGHWVQKLGANVELHKNLAGNGVFLFGSAYYRIVYPINDRLEWMAQPTVNYALRLTDRLNAPFYVKPYGLGLSVGVIWRLNTAPNKP